MTNEMPDWRSADEYTMDTTGTFRKSITVFARFGSSVWPMAYIARPKWVSEDDFADFIRALDMKVSP